jgi:tetratricopeptide (TPR) repeat protein
MTMKNLYKISVVFIIMGFISCESVITKKETGDTVIVGDLQNQEQLEMMLNGIYDVTANYFNGRGQNFYELLSDNLGTPISQDDYTQVYNLRTDFFNGNVSSYYGDPYIAIQRANNFLDMVGSVPDVTDEFKQRAIPEAIFLRGIAHLDIVRLFAQPYGYTSDNSHPGIAVVQSVIRTPTSRSNVAEVYAAIEQDLLEAAESLPESNGIYADKYAAYGFLAEMYMQMANYQNVVDYTSRIINSNRYSLDPSIDRFSYTGIGDISPEAIFTTVSINEPENDLTDNRASGFVDNYRPGGLRLVVSKDFIQEYFSAGFNPQIDKRADWFLTVNPGTENELFALVKFDYDMFNVPVIHLTDMKLLRAEALALLNTDLETARQDLNDIISRAGRTDLVPSGATANQIVERVRYERRIEMIGEGDRINHLKRIGAFEDNGLIIRESTWDCDGMILQFPVSERTSIFDLNPSPKGPCL